jgi:hypothetical protein
MKKIILLLAIFIACYNQANAHSGHSQGAMHEWHIGNTHLHGYFYMLKNNEVYIENEQHHLQHFPLTAFAPQDKQVFIDRYKKIELLNAEIANANLAPATIASVKSKNNYFSSFNILLFASIIILGFLFFKATFFRSKLKYITPFLMLGIATILMSEGKKTRSTSDPLLIDKAFIPFKPNVHTLWDANWFYVESKGIPTTHGMMVGISNHGWQQQVPLPHCYIGASAWQVPLNPVLASTPVPVNAAHFSKGAIAIAVNGVPIFNPYTNTGVDAFLDGQLDNFGGHCGRGDDYHYHTAPLHLYGFTNDTLPIAYALDGYSIFGTKEHDGTAMSTLDVNHGHNYGGTYHYHGSAAAPYMIANMVGVVTEDANKQIIPQPQGNPIRTENWGPLNGALITACTPNGAGNGYTLSYTLNGVSGYAITYNWSGTTYTFDYITPSGTTTKTYTGPAPCTVPNAIQEIIKLQNSITIYPNPVHDLLNINFSNQILENQNIEINIFNIQGAKVFSTNKFVHAISFNAMQAGTYFIKIKIGEMVFSRVVVKG